MRVLMMGCGRLGQAVGLALAAQGHQVWAARRKAGLIPAPLCPLKVKLEEGRGLQALPRALDLALYCIAPSHYTDAGYAEAYPEGLQRFLQALPDNPAVILVSSTSVYHQSRHEWVDEDSPTRPRRFSGRRILQAEHLLHKSRFRAASVRLAGIYGSESGQLVQRVRTGLEYPAEPLQYTNRIHTEDARGVLLHLSGMVERDEPLHPCYLASDSTPAPRHEVAAWLRERLSEEGAMLPKPSKTPTAPKTQTNRRSAGSKRCNNRRLLKSGYKFVHPDYRSGYAEVLKNLSKQQKPTNTAQNQPRR